MATPVGVLVLQIGGLDYSSVCIENYFQVGVQELPVRRLVSRCHKKIAESPWNKTAVYSRCRSIR